MKIAGSIKVSKSSLVFLVVLTAIVVAYALNPYSRNMIILLLIILGVPYLTLRKSPTKENQLKMTSPHVEELSPAQDPETYKKPITNNFAVYFLYAVLAYSLLAWPLISMATDAAERGESGTEFIGLAILFIIVYPSIALLIIYSIVFSLTDKSRYSPAALKKREYALRISWGYWAVIFIGPQLILFAS